MATEKYFDKFPVITYSNNQAIDITKRVVLLDRVSTNPYVFYPYEIGDSERAEQFSGRYYDDVYKSWILYLSNKITDPYYDWYMSNDEFENFIIMKYSSSDLSKQKIKYYRNGWETDVETNISLSEYNALSYGQKNYFEPNYSASGSIDFYKRKQKNWTHVTNKIVSYTVTANTFQISSLKHDEIIKIVFDNNHSGNGQFLKADSGNNVIFLQHLRGTYHTNTSVTITPSSYIQGTESNVIVPFTSLSFVANNIASDEEVYWSGVSYYDFEYEKNEYNKTIRVMEKNLKQVAADNLRDLLKEPF